MLKCNLLLVAAVLVGDFESTTPLENSSAVLAPRPPVIKLRHSTETLSYRISIRPGVPDIQEAFSVELELAKVLNPPDPIFGSRQPIDNAEIYAVLLETHASASMPSARMIGNSYVAGRKGIRLGDAGTYGFSFLVSKPGIYSLHVRGNIEKIGPVQYATILPVATWPLPQGMSFDKPFPFPKKKPPLEPGDLLAGRVLCKQHCRKDLAQTSPKGKTPTFLQSDFALGLGDQDLVQAMLLPQGLPLTKLQHANLLYYLRSLHWNVADFFPEATAFLAHAFTINQYGLNRLWESIGLKLDDKNRTHTILAVYGSGQSTKKAKQQNSPQLIAFSDRVGRDRYLKPANRLGYLFFVRLTNEPKAQELVLALGKPPVYPILAIRARAANGYQDIPLNRQLASFVGLGKFNDPSSLNKGFALWKKRLLPVYLKAAEFATMYYAQEREFTEFDALLGEGEQAKTEAGKMKLKNK